MIVPIPGRSNPMKLPCFGDFYQELFTTANSTPSNATLDLIPHVITSEMNSMLTADFLECEVELALKQMAPLKAPKPDGVSPLFYQHFWQVVHHDMVSSILSQLNTCILPLPINHTFLTLIPKPKNPEYVHEHHPISLCNVLYKIFSKVLANRLKSESSNLCINTLERLDPQLQNNQFKLYVKQLVCGK